MKLNQRLKLLSESATTQLNAQAQKLKFQGRDIINLTVGELDFDTPLFIQDAIKNKLYLNKYTPTLGLRELRQEIARKIKKEYYWSVSEENIGVTAGAKQALFAIFQIILNPSEEVIIPMPAWVSYEHQVRLANGQPIFASLKSDFDLDIQAIKNKISSKTKAIILNSPHNPTGKRLKGEKRPSHPSSVPSGQRLRHQLRVS